MNISTFITTRTKLFNLYYIELVNLFSSKRIFSYDKTIV